MDPIAELPADDPLRHQAVYLGVVCRGQRRPGATREAARLARATHDWDALLRRFEREALATRAGALLQTLETGTVPDEVREALRRRRRDDSLWALTTEGALVRVLEALRGAGIDALALKGPALAALLGEDGSTRTYGDLDLLVRRAQRTQAQAVLERLGTFQGPPPPAHPASPLRRSTSAVVSGPHGVDVDFHWALSQPGFPFALEQQGVWRRAIAVRVGATGVRTFGVEDALLFLCVHAGKDLWPRWSPLADLTRLIDRHPGLDWTLVERLARGTGTRRMLHVGMLLAHALAGATVPPPVLRRARADTAAGTQAARFAHGLLRPHAHAPDAWQWMKGQVGLRERPAQKLEVIAGVLAQAFEPREAVVGPPWKHVAARARRIATSLRRYGRRTGESRASSDPR